MKDNYIICAGGKKLCNGRECSVNIYDLEKVFLKTSYGYSSIEIHKDCLQKLVQEGQVIRDKDNTWIEV